MTEEDVGRRGLVRPHLRYQNPVAAITWLCRVFGFREEIRLDRGGDNVTSELVGPDGGVVMASGLSDDFKAWMRDRVTDFQEPRDHGWPYLSHTISVLIVNVDAHYRHARAEGASVLTFPTDQPWGLRTYAALDLEGHQWEFAEVVRAVDPEVWGARRTDPTTQ